MRINRIKLITELEKQDMTQKCDLRLYCYLSPSERPGELVSLVISFLHSYTETQTHYYHHSAASYPCIGDMDMSTALGADCLPKPHNPQQC